jgi:hypothetical protein
MISGGSLQGADRQWRGLQKRQKRQRNFANVNIKYPGVKLKLFLAKN